MVRMLIYRMCFQGYDIVNHTRTVGADYHALSYLSGHIFSAPYPRYRRLCPPFLSAHQKISRCFSFTANVSKGGPLLPSLVISERGFHFPNRRKAMKDRLCVHAALDVANGVDNGVEVITDLGMDTLTLLAVTVIVVPAFKFIKASPVSTLSMLFYFCFWCA